jgi:hypothetical protein
MPLLLASSVPTESLLDQNLNITPQVWDPYTSENIYSLEKSKDVQNVMYATDNTAPVMSQTLCAQLANSAIQERRI